MPPARRGSLAAGWHALLRSIARDRFHELQLALARLDFRVQHSAASSSPGPDRTPPGRRDCTCQPKTPLIEAARPPPPLLDTSATREALLLSTCIRKSVQRTTFACRQLSNHRQGGALGTLTEMPAPLAATAITTGAEVLKQVISSMKGKWVRRTAAATAVVQGPAHHAAAWRRARCRCQAARCTRSRAIPDRTARQSRGSREA